MHWLSSRTIIREEEISGELRLPSSVQIGSPLLLPIDMLDPNNNKLQSYVENSNHLIDGKYLLGGTSANLTNAFSDMLAAGYIKK